MSHPIVQTISLVAAAATGIAQAQSLAGAGNLVLNGSLVSGGVATLDSGGAARRVIIASVADDSTLVWTITGTIRDPGNPSSSTAAVETLAGAGAGLSVQSLNDFLTVTRIAGSKATAGNVTAGTNGWGSAPAVPWDRYGPPFEISVAAYVLAGAPTYQLEVTYDDVYGTWLATGQSVKWIAWPDMTGKSADAQTKIDADICATRLTLTAVGSVQVTQRQQDGHG